MRIICRYRPEIDSRLVVDLTDGKDYTVRLTGVEWYDREGDPFAIHVDLGAEHPCATFKTEAEARAAFEAVTIEDVHYIKAQYTEIDKLEKLKDACQANIADRIQQSRKI